MGRDPDDPATGRDPAHTRGRTMAAGPPKGAAEAQKLEVESSRRSVDGTQRYELTSRSKSPMNKVVVVAEPAAAAQGEAQGPAQAQAPARRNADGRAAQAGPPMPGSAAQQQGTPRRNVPIVHPNRSPSPHAKLPPTTTPPKRAASPRSVPIVHPMRSPSPRKAADAAAARNARQGAEVDDRVGQNRNPNAQAGVGPAKDLRGRMTAAMQRSAGAPPPHGGVGGARPRNAPALRNGQPQAHPGVGRGHAGPQQETRQAMPALHADSGRPGAHPPPLHPFSCMNLFMPISGREARGKQEGTGGRPAAPHSTASSNDSLGDDDFLKELHGHPAADFRENAAAAPSPIRGFDGSCTVIHQVDHSCDWGDLAEGSPTFVRGGGEHDAESAHGGMVQPLGETVQEAPAVLPMQITEALHPRMARHAAVAASV